MAAREVAVLQKRLKEEDAHRRLRLASFTVDGGRLDSKSNGIDINEAEAVLIREAAQRILEGGSLRAIAKSWNERGIRTSWDKPINETGLKKMLCSGRVAGFSEYQKEIIGKAKWDAILDEATWQQAAYHSQRPGQTWATPQPGLPASWRPQVWKVWSLAGCQSLKHRCSSLRL